MSEQGTEKTNPLHGLERDGTGTGTGVWTHPAAEPGQPEQPEHRAIVKLTDAQGQTRGRMQWGPGVTHAVEYTGALCSAGVLHAYEASSLRDALALAILRDPEDGRFGSTARAWVCRGSGQHVSNGIKSGHETLTTVREIQLPAVSIEQRVECAIRLAWEVCDEPGWRAWAQAWLDGSDRTDAAAWAAADAADAGVDVAAISGSVLLPEWTDEGGDDGE